MTTAIPPVLIEFATAGIRDVDRAFGTLDQRIARFERDSERASSRSSATRVRTAESETAKREKAYARLTKELEREEKRATKESERQSRMREQIHRRSSEMAGREAEKAASLEIRAAQKSAREIEKLEEYKLRVRIRSSEMAGRIAEREAAAEASARARASRATGAALSRGASGVGRVAGMAAGALSIGGGFAMADAVHKQLAAEKQAAMLVNIATLGNGNVAPAGANTADILRQASKVSVETGVSKADLLEGSVTYARNARNGDFQGAMGNMGFMAKMSRVTGASINDLAEAAGTLQSQNPDLDSTAMQQMLLNVAAQSGKGSMSMVDAARQVGKLGATRSSYSGDVGATQRSLIGLGQIARVGGDKEEAGTFIQDLSDEAHIANKKFRKAHGRDLIQFDEHGRMSSPEQLVADVFRGTKGNIGEIGDLFGKRGSPLFRELEKSYLTGEKKGGVEGGVKSALANMSEVTGATMTPEQLEAMHKKDMSENAEKLDAAFNKITTTLGDQLEPTITSLADKLPGIVAHLGVAGEALAEFAKLIVDNPVPAALTLLATKLGGTPGTMAELLIAGIAAIDWAAAADRAVQRKHVAGDIDVLNEVSDLNAKVRTGKVTPEDIQKAEQVQADQAKNRNDQTDSWWDVVPGVAGVKAAGAAVDYVSGGDRAAQDDRDAKRMAASADLLAKALDRARVAADKLANADPGRHKPINERN